MTPWEVALMYALAFICLCLVAALAGDTEPGAWGQDLRDDDEEEGAR